MADQPEWVAGVDEVGRGALFGPVVAAAVILSPQQETELAQAGVTDSKKLTASRRTLLATQIRNQATGAQVAYATVWEIDRLNILQASLLAMARAIGRVSPRPTRCLIDGNQRVPHLAIAQETWVKGDSRSVAIAAASILAKVWRDELIVRPDARYPGYDLASNKGYGSPKHRQALLRLGPTRQHRRSFAPCRGAGVEVEPDRSATPIHPTAK